MAKPSATWTIISALAAQLVTITVANGYLTDVGKNVWTTDGQRQANPDALGLMIYAESISGADPARERPAKPARDFLLSITAAIDTDMDTAQQRIHDVIEDIEVCMAQYAQAQFNVPPPQQLPMHVTDIGILDRPEGAAFIGCEVHVSARYFR